MTREQERDRYIEAILGGRVRFHLHLVNGGKFAPETDYRYWKRIHQRWIDLWMNA